MKDPEDITDNELEKEQSDLVYILEATTSGIAHPRIASTVSKLRDESSAQTSTAVIADQIGKNPAGRALEKMLFKSSVGITRKEILNEFANQEADISAMQSSDIQNLRHIALSTESRHKNVFGIQISDPSSISQELQVLTISLASEEYGYNAISSGYEPDSFASRK